MFVSEGFGVHTTALISCATQQKLVRTETVSAAVGNPHNTYYKPIND